eukprot:TRINITY_DN62946_c0_g1_i1.p1 TRINITY_DN62946_c0_g1~~TRINITY_DN62946_c0_g1_i1.p1  ORF type:complete len:165 (+),score=39.45 TRINITY_DN62946_c0_g1_i1:2-496(+)
MGALLAAQKDFWTARSACALCISKMGNCPCFAFLGSSKPLLSPEEQAAANANLKAAVKDGNVAKIQKAVDAGADVNYADTAFFNYTPLHLSAGKGAVEVVQLLLAERAEVDPRSTTDETPLIMAARAKHKVVVQILLDHGADVEAKTNYKPPMAKAAKDYIAEM